jgi:hypothetical protein
MLEHAPDRPARLDERATGGGGGDSAHLPLGQPLRVP